MAKTTFNVLQIVSNLEVGGAQEVVRTLAENLAIAGSRPTVCAFKDGPLRQEIEKLGIPVEILPDRQHRVIALPAFLKEMWQLRKHLSALVAQYEIDVVQTHLLRSLDFLVLSLVFTHKLLVFWTFQNAQFDLRADHLDRNGWLLKPKRFSHHLLYRWGARRVNGFIAVSEDVKASILQTMSGIPADKVAVIFNSVDVDRYRRPVDRDAIRTRLHLHEQDAVMIVVATFKRQKGHRFLIEAIGDVVLQFPSLKVLLVGDGELRQEMEIFSESLGLRGNILFMGTRMDVPDLLAISDCFILPSLWEGLSMALVEAMASELPVIATEVSGTTQVVVPGETGLLVPPGEVAALANAMIAMLSDPGQAQAMGVRGRQRVEQYFSARKQASDHIALFEQQVEQAGWRLATNVRK